MPHMGGASPRPTIEPIACRGRTHYQRLKNGPMLASAQRVAAEKSETRPAKSKSGGSTELWDLPEWNLDDLYAGLEDPRVARDLDQVDADSAAFEEAYKGKLAVLLEAPGGGRVLAEAVKRYETLDDLIGRLISYAGLVHAGNTIDPARAKFYGDVQDRVTAASTHLLFFVLELNRIDDGKLAAAMADAKLAYY